MRLVIKSTEDLVGLREAVEVEFKLAAGRDGKGAAPKDLWRSYSAMANTQGGEIILGVRERADGEFELAGIANPHKVVSDLWSVLNSEKVSVNLLTDPDIRILEIEGVSLVHLHVPRAGRSQRPVYINGNPIKGTYRRFHEGDHHCNAESVRRMLADQVEDSRDERLLVRFRFDDLDQGSLTAYRQMLRSAKPDHPWNDHNDLEFLRCIGGWRHDRETGDEGPTLAGLLMFGKLPSIQEAMPHYFLDYQERAEAKTEKRWIDRLTLDGTWSGNLFDFYRIVIRKLTAELKIPFQLEDGQRIDDTPVHEALREALVNTLVHADFSGRLSVLVVKRPDMFGFRNPGLMRIPVEQAIRGGESDCRNRFIHQMFLLIGLGERAGSGIPKIYRNWQSQHWRQPLLYEKQEPEQTLFELRMIDLFPADIVQGLREALGERFDQLSELEHLVLVTAAVEKVVKHSRIMEVTAVHPHDLTMVLAGLVRSGLLVSEGGGRGTVYYLPGAGAVDIDQAFTSEVIDFSELTAAQNGTCLGQSKEVRGRGSEVRAEGPEVRSEGPEVRADGPEVSEEIREQLLAIAEPVRSRGRSPRDEVELIILKLCEGRYLTLRTLAGLLDRSGEFLRKEYLNPLVKTKKLEIRYPTKPNHPDQAYRSVVQ